MLVPQGCWPLLSEKTPKIFRPFFTLHAVVAEKKREHSRIRDGWANVRNPPKHCQDSFPTQMSHKFLCSSHGAIRHNFLTVSLTQVLTCGLMGTLKTPCSYKGESDCKVNWGKLKSHLIKF